MKKLSVELSMIKLFVFAILSKYYTFNIITREKFCIRIHEFMLKYKKVDQEKTR